VASPADRSFYFRTTGSKSSALFDAFQSLTCSVGAPSL
jgi:hypothetical protein